MAPCRPPSTSLMSLGRHASTRSADAAAAATPELQRRQTRLAWLLLLPALAVVAFVAIYPLGKTIYQSFTNQEFLAGIEPTKWVGLENYRDLMARHDLPRHRLADGQVHADHRLASSSLLGLIIALVVNSHFKGRGFMRAIMLVPWAIPTVVAAQMWKWMLDDIFGVVNDLGVRTHILSHSHAWISDPTTALAAVCAVDIWKTTPFVALLLLAGLQVIPKDLYEAADVDGASQLQQFWRITLPLLRAGDPRRADLPHARRVARLRRLLRLLRQSRPDTQTMSIYDQSTIVGDGYVGYGAAMSVAIFLIISLFVVIYVTFMRVTAQDMSTADGDHPRSRAGRSRGRSAAAGRSASRRSAASLFKLAVLLPVVVDRRLRAVPVLLGDPLGVHARRRSSSRRRCSTSRATRRWTTSARR